MLKSQFNPFDQKKDQKLLFLKISLEFCSFRGSSTVGVQFVVDSPAPSGPGPSHRAERRAGVSLLSIPARVKARPARRSFCRACIC